MSTTWREPVEMLRHRFFSRSIDYRFQISLGGGHPTQALFVSIPRRIAMALAPKLTKYDDRSDGLHKFFNGHPDQIGLGNLIHELPNWLGRNRRRGWFPVSTEQLEPYYPRGKGLLAMLADTGLIKLMMSENECLVYLDIEHVIYQDCWRAWSDGNVYLTKEEIRARLMENDRQRNLMGITHEAYSDDWE